MRSGESITGSDSVPLKPDRRRVRLVVRKTADWSVQVAGRRVVPGLRKEFSGELDR